MFRAVIKAAGQYVDAQYATAVAIKDKVVAARNIINKENLSKASDDLFADVDAIVQCLAAQNNTTVVMATAKFDPPEGNMVEKANVANESIARGETTIK